MPSPHSAVLEQPPTVLATPLEDGAVRCGVCAHRCVVRPGRHGICGVRENRDGTLVSLVYGEAVSAAVDPIEKKPLFHFAPGTTAYSVATVGCPFHCAFCQNWEIAQAPRLGLEIPTRRKPPSRLVAEAVGSGSATIAYTYVEPTVFIEYALDTATIAHDVGLHNVFVTDGYMTPEAIRLLAPVLDGANVDLKSFDDRFYRRLCGARLQPVLDAIVGLRAAGVWIELTTLLIPGFNDDPTGLRALTRWIVDAVGPETPWHVSRFHPAYRMLDVAPTPHALLLQAVEIGREAGLRHVYAGNARELRLEDTSCAGCGAVLIRRDGYRTRIVGLEGGRCRSCRRALAGRFIAADAVR